MAKRTLGRKKVIDAMVAEFERIDRSLAFWEAGAASFDRVDEWSDMDLYLVVDDDAVEDAFRSLDGVIEGLGGASTSFRLPEPTWHGHSQAFYQLRRASPYLYVDIVIMKRSAKDKFLQFAIHERPRVHFDKVGIVRDDPIDVDAFVERVEKRVRLLKATFGLFQTDTLKEINRGNYVEAFMYYVGGTYRPLLEALRMKYTPLHFNFGGRYAHYELPPEVVKRLKGFLYVKDMRELRRRHSEAGRWFSETIDSIDFNEMRELVRASVKSPAKGARSK